ncbi:hypothetical protein BDZ85DRAFT_272022 [Elsinoe ampelina]|uniref:Uncharacterized protein n=1 Tax=Elsinoe ampelina TaxID=302913 RepID=A0A6A6GM97_9PEZI|nr:hypothetical protein BDZ85DRAFT_272022 [Elsinoe ampelina]
MASTALASLWEQTIGRIRPIDVDSLPFVRQRPAVSKGRTISCPRDPPDSVTDRTEFGQTGCLIYGYPSSGGVLNKEADVLDMIFLSLPRSTISYRSNDTNEEDQFCRLLLRTGATLWPSKQARFEADIGARYRAKEEKKIMVYAWPPDGKGVWVLRYESERQMPRDFGRARMAMDMEEKIEMMKQYNATFVEDVSQIEELRDAYTIVEMLVGLRELPLDTCRTAEVAQILPH